MFNFSKKKTDPIKENLGSFQDGFTKEQKAVIIGSLMILANFASKNGKTYPLKIQQIEHTAKLLDFELDDLALFIDQIMKGGYNKQYVIKVLNSFDRGQKEWYAIVIWTILVAGGITDAAEMRFASGTLGDIGISEDEFKRIIQKSNAWMKTFGLDK